VGRPWLFSALPVSKADNVGGVVSALGPTWIAQSPEPVQIQTRVTHFRRRNAALSTFAGGQREKAKDRVGHNDGTARDTE
jgi:hypothetical protein